MNHEIDHIIHTTGKLYLLCCLDIRLFFWKKNKIVVVAIISAFQRYPSTDFLTLDIVLNTTVHLWKTTSLLIIFSYTGNKKDIAHVD